jgi:hypothetical protein
MRALLLIALLFFATVVGATDGVTPLVGVEWVKSHIGKDRV